MLKAERKAVSKVALQLWGSTPRIRRAIKKKIVNKQPIVSSRKAASIKIEAV